MKKFLAVCLPTLVAASTLFGGDMPPDSAKPLSEVLQAIDNVGYRDVSEVDFDGGRWEIEAMKNGVAVDIVVDPQTLKVLREEGDDRHLPLPVGAKPLVAIIKQLEGLGYRAISEVDLEGASWEIDAVRNGTRFELLVDAASGSITSERTRLRQCSQVRRIRFADEHATASPLLSIL